MAASCPPARGGARFSDCRAGLGERLRCRALGTDTGRRVGKMRAPLSGPLSGRRCAEEAAAAGALALKIISGNTQIRFCVMDPSEDLRSQLGHLKSELSFLHVLADISMRNSSGRQGLLTSEMTKKDMKNVLQRHRLSESCHMVTFQLEKISDSGNAEAHVPGEPTLEASLCLEKLHQYLTTMPVEMFPEDPKGRTCASQLPL
ncbi:uncharacterized protein [Castor canadensis]|uniref:Uncharacterized protein n=1 Tax=Castor canadensis TaxID=51338 RepID=A0AC58KV55_CASCN